MFRIGDTFMLTARRIGFVVAAFVALAAASPAEAQSFAFSDPTSSSSLTGTFPSFTIIGPQGHGSGTALYSAAFSAAGSMSFTWNYHSNDCDGPSYDPAGFSVDGTSTQLTDSGGTVDQAGSETIQVAAGQTFGWYVFSTDGSCGAGVLTVSATFTPNFGASAASQVAQTFVTTRQQLLLDALNFPSIFNRGTNGMQVQAGSNGLVNALAFSATTNGRLTPAETALTRTALSRDLATPEEAAATGGVNFWIDGQFGLHSSGGTAGRFAVGTMGIDKLINDRVLIGFAAEGDWVTSPTATSDVSGLGFLLGTYASVAIGENMAINAHVLVGRSWNNESVTQPGGTYSGNFQTGRLDLGASLAGKFSMDLLTVMPDVSFSLINEGTGEYTLTGSSGQQAVPGFVVTTYEASAGSTFEYRLDQGNGVIVSPSAGLRIGLDTSTATSIFAAGFLGVTVETENGLAVDLGLQSRVSSSGLRTLAARASVAGHF